jgi:hypothetical protein
MAYYRAVACQSPEAIKCLLDSGFVAVLLFLIFTPQFIDECIKNIIIYMDQTECMLHPQRGTGHKRHSMMLSLHADIVW